MAKNLINRRMKFPKTYKSQEGKYGSVSHNPNQGNQNIMETAISRDKPFRIGTTVSMIDTKEEPAMKFYNYANVVSYGIFSPKNGWLIKLEMLQDKGETSAYSSNLKVADKQYKEEGATVVELHEPTQEELQKKLRAKSESALQHAIKNPDDFIKNHIIFGRPASFQKPDPSEMGTFAGTVDPKVAAKAWAPNVPIKEVFEAAGKPYPNSNPLIGDNYFKLNPSNVLGEQVIEKGRFGSEFVKVKGSATALDQINVPLVPIAVTSSDANLTTESQKQIIDKVFEQEKHSLVETKIRKKKEQPAAPNQVAARDSQQVYSIRETAAMYNTSISRAELEAYYFTRPLFDYTLLFDAYTYDKNHFLANGLVAVVYEGDAYTFEYVYVYKSGNISKKISSLRKHKEKLVESFGTEQYEKQLKMLEEVRPKQKGWIGEDRIIVLPHSNFAREIKISELRYGKPELNGDTSIFEAFVAWLRHISPDNFKKSNSREVIDYYLMNKSIPIDQKAEKSIRERQEKNAINIRQRTKDEGDELFGKFLAEELLSEDQAKIAYLWNEKYNSIAEPDLTKIPIGFRMSKSFKNNVPFILSATQRQAVAFMLEKKSALLAYGVGVGKTGSAIAAISQAIDNGLAQKPLIVVPTNTYFKWIGEIQGYTDKENGIFYQGLLPHLPKVVGLYNLNAEIVRSELKEYSPAEEKKLTSIETLIQTLKNLDVDTLDNKSLRSRLSSIYPINWNGLDAAYEEYSAQDLKRKKSPVQFVADYYTDELRFMVYDLGKIKEFPNGTIFITTEQGIQKLGISDENKGQLSNFLYTILSQGESSNSKDRAKEIAGLQLKIEQTISSSLKRAKLNVEDFAFDFVCFDESHYYKKIFTYVKGSIKDVEEGDDGSKKYKRDKTKYELKSGSYPSSRALSAFVLSHYIQSKNNNRNVLHLTATPFTNSPLEIYSMLALTNYKSLEDLGVQNMVDFFDTFMKINYDIKYTASKEVVKDVVLLGFNNLPQMRQIIYSLIDKKDEGANLKRPVKWIFPSIQKAVETTLPMTLEQNEIIRDIKSFIAGNTEYAALCADAISEEVGEIDFEGMSDEVLIQTFNESVRPDEDLTAEYELSDADREKLIKAIKKAKIGTSFSQNDLSETENTGARILQALSAMRQVTLSPYTWNCKRNPEIKKTLTYKKYIDSSPKLTYVMGCIKSVIEHHKDKGTKFSGQVIYINAGVEFFPLIKEFIVKQIGLKESQVGIVSGGMSKGAKETVKRGFLNGDILVLIGSATISVGIDLQNNSTVLYNCYYDWNPTDAQQVEGRIWRQGNRFANVRIVYPMCYNSVDPVMFQYLTEKTSRINEIWNREGRTSELDLRDFDPKKLQKDLITDPEEKADWEILEEAEKVESQIIYFENRLESIENAKKVVLQLKEDKPEVIEALNNASVSKAEMKRKAGIESTRIKREVIMDKYSRDQEKTNSELAALEKTRYDYVGDPDGRYKAVNYDLATDEELYLECKRVVDWLDDLDYSSADAIGDMYYNRRSIINLLTRYRGNYKDFKSIVDRVLVPLGLNIETLENPARTVGEKVAVLRAQLEDIDKSRADRVAKYRKQQMDNKFAVTVADRVREFAAFNYLLDEEFPQAVLPKETLDDKLKKLYDMLIMKMEMGGIIDTHREFTDSDLLKLQESGLFTTKPSAQGLMIFTSNGRQVGIYKPTYKKLNLKKGYKPLNENELLKWLSDNGYMSESEIETLGCGGCIHSQMENGGLITEQQDERTNQILESVFERK